MIDKYYTNYGMSNHNVETCKNKEETTMVAIELAPHSQKPQKTFSYACHIYGLNGHTITYCPKFVKIQKLFHGKFVIGAKVQLVVKVKTITANVNVVMLML
jgi:hypothetical protein